MTDNKLEKTGSYLVKKEWSMGNGQCPECCGVPPRWHGRWGYFNTDTIGHKQSCMLAAALRELRHTPLILGHYESDREFERFLENGFFGVREKTEDGCEAYLEWENQNIPKLPQFSLEEAIQVIDKINKENKC